MTDEVWAFLLGSVFGACLAMGTVCLLIDRPVLAVAGMLMCGVVLTAWARRL